MVSHRVRSSPGAPENFYVNFSIHPTCDRMHSAKRFFPTSQLNTLRTTSTCIFSSETNFKPAQHASFIPRATINESAANTAATPPPPSSPCSQPLFDEMYSLLSTWRYEYRTTIVPRNAYDAGPLGDWMAAIRRLHRRGTLPPWAISKLEELDIQWAVDGLDAKWHSNFHAAREFKEVHGGDACDLDTALLPDYSGEEGKDVKADWIEAARWLDRQRDLYAGEKLTDYRVWVLKRVLGKRQVWKIIHIFMHNEFCFLCAGIKLHREYTPRRKNIHPALLKANKEFKRLVEKDEAAAFAALASNRGTADRAA